MIIYASDENFDELYKNGPVMVDFFGKTCGPCRMIAAVMEELDDSFPFVSFIKVDVDECPKTAQKYQVSGIPDLYFYRDGQEIAHELGAISENMIRSHLAEILY